jgi:Bacterial protein of unknown function (DUF922)
MQISRILLLALLLFPRMAHAQGATWAQDVVSGGTCKQLVERWRNAGVTEAGGTSNPGKWAVTTSTLLIDGVAADVDESVNGIVFAEKQKTKDGKKCVVWSGFDFHLEASHKITALEWQHGLKPDSKCAIEWKRVSDAIAAHEPKHAADVDALVAAANKRTKKLAPITACSTGLDAARRKAAKVVKAELEKELAKIRSEAKKKAKKLDVETIDMNCPCEEKLAFSGVDLFCDIKTPVCTLRSGQRFEAEVCGNPLTATWTVTPHYYTTGCGAVPSTSGDKPFDNDCVPEGGAEDKRRAAIHKNAPGGAGGWFCVYGDSPKPHVTIRSYRVATCAAPKEQTVTVDVVNKGACE